MARSAHAYVRGNTAQYYEWLESVSPESLPQGPAIWICGDCHVGNLGPVADAQGDVEIQIRDFDQTVIGNPAHDLIRLGLSLSMAARSSDLPGVTTALMVENLASGYDDAFELGKAPIAIPKTVTVALKDSRRRTWRKLAQERLQGKTASLPLGRKFWPVAVEERQEIERVFSSAVVQDTVFVSRDNTEQSQREVLDCAYWRKGCSSLGRLRYAVLLDTQNQAQKQKDLFLMDVKEAGPAVAPHYTDVSMPQDNARRVIEGARHLSPNLGARVAHAEINALSVFIRELLPQDLKLEFERITRKEARRAAYYLAWVVGRAHARQMDEPTRKSWRRQLVRSHSKSLDAPSWLWTSVVELVATHERGYLHHCRKYALSKGKNAIAG